MRHKESGIIVRCESERSQKQNIETAFIVMNARLLQKKMDEEHSDLARTRKELVGSGQRGDKIRTIRYQDGVVIDHISGKKWRLSDYMEGKW